MNRYNANTGSFERIPEAEPSIFQPSPGFIDLDGSENKKTSGQSGILGGLGGMLDGLGDASGGLGSILGGASGGLGSILGGLGSGTGGIGGLLSRFSLANLELEDIMLVAFLYLLYRESGDIEFLLIAGAMLFL
ncbi:MAG: hypothetical protein EOM51_08210 [Clostridia bacterium]|nr:hypothetical protein [Clostridia bacterium]